jgi:hypothetical protein
VADTNSSAAAATREMSGRGVATYTFFEA